MTNNGSMNRDKDALLRGPAQSGERTVYRKNARCYDFFKDELPDTLPAQRDLYFEIRLKQHISLPV